MDEFKRQKLTMALGGMYQDDRCDSAAELAE